jgi:hypothetical protein
MKRYLITKWSGEFRFEKEPMTSEEIKEFVEENRKDKTDYLYSSSTIDSLEDAKAVFEAAQKHLSITEYPSNKVMVIPWLTLEEEEIDEDGEIIPSDCWIKEFYPEKGEGNIS